MKIEPLRFQSAFVQRAEQALAAANEATPAESAALPLPVEGVTLSAQPASSDSRRFQAAVSAVAASAAMGGVPGLAAMAQEVARGLVSGAEELDASRRLTEQFTATLPKVDDPRVAGVWSRVSEATESPYEAPLVFQSFFIDAQADARTIMLGTETLKGDLADDNVLAFTLAHEEGHRQNRDTAGAAGLQALLDSCENDSELSQVAFVALGEGRRQNERKADLFAAEAMLKLGYDKQPILDFLSALPGDLQHPAGLERAAMVQSVFSA